MDYGGMLRKGKRKIWLTAHAVYFDVFGRNAINDGLDGCELQLKNVFFEFFV